MSVIDGFSWLLLIGGGFFCITGGLGLLRLPDLYTRVHGGGLTDTLGATLLLAGLVLQADSSGVAVKLILIGILLHVTAPTGTHALVKSAYARGVRAQAERR